ncbi:MAG: PmoA family protein [Verrucomicrobiae bacterium]|nr:PmoA family protein [Verrucomicrobiae bacterium]
MNKPFPRIRCYQEPGDRVVVTLDGQLVFSYYFGASYPRPFIYPLLTARGHNVLAYGHSVDLVGHSHHRGLFIAHADAGGQKFWADRDGRCVQQRLLKLEDGVEEGTVAALNHWIADNKVLLVETREFTLRANRTLRVTLEFTAPNGDVVFAATKFGFLACRVAKTIGVAAGGGKIRDAMGRVNEKGVFGQRAAWCDYSGPVAPGKQGEGDVWAGVTIVDDPSNPHHPTPWMCRDDGWFSPAFNMIEPFTLKKGGKLTLRYRVNAHDGPDAVTA